MMYLKPISAATARTFIVSLYGLGHDLPPNVEWFMATNVQRLPIGYDYIYSKANRVGSGLKVIAGNQKQVYNNQNRNERDGGNINAHSSLITEKE